MLKKKSKIHKLMDEKPEMFDFGDILPDRVQIPEQEKWYEDNSPQWAKDLAAKNRR